MVPHLQHIGLEGTAIFLLQIILHRRLCVAGEQHGKVSIMKLHDNAGIIKALLVLLAQKVPGSQYLKIIPLAQLHSVPGLEHPVVVMPGTELRIKPAGNGIIGVWHGIVINIADLVFACQPFNIAQMVPMMVGNKHRVNFIHVFPHPGLAQSHLQCRPAAVAQLILPVVSHIHHDLALSILQQDGFTLPHVQHGNTQLALWQRHCLAGGGQGRLSTCRRGGLGQLLLHRRPHRILMGLIKECIGNGGDNKGHQHLDY